MTTDSPFDPRITPLTAAEARVLATLMEKARTVPDTYPLTLNSLVTGCNQKTSREPVMNLSDADALAALDALRAKGLVQEAGGGRTSRFSHHTTRVLAVPDQSAALLGLLMLRGPQTAGELRLNAERWHRFADISSVDAFLQELAERAEEKGGPLVALLPRAPGARESRWAQLLTGPSAQNSAADAAPRALNADGDAGGDANDELAALTARVAALETRLNELCEALGLSQKRPVSANDCDRTAPLIGD